MKLDLGTLTRLEGDIRTGLAGSDATGPWGTLKGAIGRRYSAFVTRRFDQFSRGGGDWAPLALSTLRSKLRKGKKGQAYTVGSRGGQTVRRLVTTGKSDRSTLARDTRRGGAMVGFSGRAAAILVETGVLRNALAIGGAGNYVQAIPDGVEFGIKGGEHPAQGGAAGPSIARLAAMHNAGAPPHLPQRQILAMPDQQTIRGIESDVRRAVGEAFKRAQGAQQ